MEFLLAFFIFTSLVNNFDDVLLCKRTFLDNSLEIDELDNNNYGNPEEIYFLTNKELTNFKSIDLKRSKYSDQKEFYTAFLKSMNMDKEKIAFNENKKMNINNNVFSRENIDSDLYPSNIVKIGVKVDMEKFLDLIFMYSEKEIIDGKEVLKYPMDKEIENVTLQEAKKLITEEQKQFEPNLNYLFDRNTRNLNFYMSNRPDMASQVMASYECNVVKRNLKNKVSK
tara:strand:+ start:19 stop:696 length:678 start_codon:yes stop_codon:yes gene_type:complete